MLDWTLGASGYTFVHAVMSQNTEDFIECHNKAFAFYGGVTNQIVPDNLKAAVITHTRKKIVLNESYADMGRHYGTAIVPARPYHPQDKSKYEKWNPGRILNWANSIGNETVALMKEIMEHRSHPVRGYKSCMAILNFSKTYSDEALELTCTKARKLGIRSVASIESILKRKTYLETIEHSVVNNTLFNEHENLRDSEIYQ